MIDDFGLYPREEPFDPFSVMLFKALQVVAFLFFIALLAMRPSQGGQGRYRRPRFSSPWTGPTITPTISISLSRTRPATSRGTGIAKPASWCSIVTTVAARTTSSSSTAKRSYRQSARRSSPSEGSSPGEYTVNVSHFQATTGQPVPATVKVQKLNPTAQVVFDDKVFVDHTGDEKTAVRFTIDSEGKVTDVNRRPKSLMETFRSVNRNGSDLDPKTGVRVR